MGGWTSIITIPTKLKRKKNCDQNQSTVWELGSLGLVRIREIIFRKSLENKWAPNRPVLEWEHLINEDGLILLWLRVSSTETFFLITLVWAWATTSELILNSPFPHAKYPKLPKWKKKLYYHKSNLQNIFCCVFGLPTVILKYIFHIPLKICSICFFGKDTK